MCTKLNENNWPAIYISGNIEQSERNKAISELKHFKCRILVSTDLVITKKKGSTVLEDLVPENKTVPVLIFVIPVLSFPEQSYFSDTRC